MATKATIRATWPDGVQMMFGTSYKKWWHQLREYCLMNKIQTTPKIEVSSQPWIGLGGLKWCPADRFQSQLDHEGKGRKVSDFEFRAPNRIELNCLATIEK